MEGYLRRVARPIAVLSAPLVGFFLIQNAVSLATLAMVGRLGSAALAGVGLASVLFTLLLALLYGLDTGAQAIVSRATGAGEPRQAGAALTQALALGAPLGLALCAVAFLAGPAVLTAMLGPGAAASTGAAFLRAASPALLLFGLTIPFNAAWIASGRPTVAFAVTAAVAPCQVLASFLLIHSANLGAPGAGMAMTAAGVLTLGLQAAIAWRWAPVPGLFARRLSRAGLGDIVRIGWPVSVQQSLSQACLLGAFAIVARLGVAEVAVINVLNNLMLAPIQLAVGLGVAAATLVGQSLGRGERPEARRWGWRAATAGAVLATPLGLIVLAAPETVLPLFISDPAVVAMAVWPARLLAAVVSLDIFARVLGFALRGAGATKAATFVPFITQGALLLPMLWIVAIVLGRGLPGFVAVEAAMLAIEALVYIVIWRSPLWVNVPIAGVGLAVERHEEFAFDDPLAGDLAPGGHVGA
ncbi:MATE family efflux transporter [Phenylobacterium sp.]|uniref:MATE family efflux transporter n=1 Tax=Phenylobacterium sp. TaxID=1871053 RepID=UPI002BED270C|nr:MATE family efflux transporter [Phenylobacterium sp.]HLZ77037.1 MATE family efflux transporter [Phenylobacterium sp.]